MVLDAWICGLCAYLSHVKQVKQNKNTTMQTEFTHEAKRAPQANEIVVQVFTGASVKFVFCESIDDAKRCVELHRNWAIPAGSVCNDAGVPDAWKMPMASIQW